MSSTVSFSCLFSLRFLTNLKVAAKTEVDEKSAAGNGDVGGAVPYIR